MSFKFLKFGKKKDKEKGKPPADESAATHIAELEEQLKDRTNGLTRTEKKLKRLSDKVIGFNEQDISRVQPHGPIGELSIKPEDSLAGVDADEQEDSGTKLKEEPEDVNLAEAEPEPKSSSPKNKKVKTNLDAESLKALFTSKVEEENPLTSLINSLPDITIDELMDDLKEIKDIIRDWQKK
jgi:hypothetical protein